MSITREQAARILGSLGGRAGRGRAKAPAHAAKLRQALSRANARLAEVRAARLADAARVGGLIP